MEEQQSIKLKSKPMIGLSIFALVIGIVGLLGVAVGGMCKTWEEAGKILAFPLSTTIIQILLWTLISLVPGWLITLTFFPKMFWLDRFILALPLGFLSTSGTVVVEYAAYGGIFFMTHPKSIVAFNVIVVSAIFFVLWRIRVKR